MKKLTCALIIMVCVMSLVGFSSIVIANDIKPTLEVVTSTVDLAKEKEVKFKAKGFASDQQFTLMFIDNDGMKNDIGAALKPDPKADAKGTWEGAWDISSYLKAKLIKEGDYTLILSDPDYKEFESKKVNFFGKPEKKKEKE